jgi:hypothetical protein
VPGKRFGRPQLFALLLLSAFVLQALWVIQRTQLRRAEIAYAHAGLDQLRGQTLLPEAGTLPVPAVVALAPMLVYVAAHPPSREVASAFPEALKWALRLPFAAIGWLLGASIWYVARRLYGNSGGYIALTLYCFSPAVFFPWPGPLLTGSLGIFGTVFVSIAVSHTLYAPAGKAIDEVRSRWRRIILLGIAIALAVGSGFWGVSLVLLGLLFMLYLVPERRLASLTLVLSGCTVAAALLLACYGFRAPALARAFSEANWLPRPDSVANEVMRAYAVGIRHAMNPVLMVLSAVALGTYLAWNRCRYFGNTAPLIALMTVAALGFFAVADVLVGPFPFRGAPFLYVFVAGVFADGLESRWRTAFGLLLLGLLAAYATVSLLTVARLRPVATH